MHLRLQQLLAVEAEDGAADALGLAQLELMLGGVAALMLFVHLNWTGSTAFHFVLIYFVSPTFFLLSFFSMMQALC
jgi:hypothetical protein